MQDRELLGLAAKAAGKREFDWVELFAEDGHPQYAFGMGITGRIYWNSITRDSDAFRLAVDLGMTISTDEEAHTVVMLRGVTFCEPHGTDKHAATRRAITRAAAASDNLQGFSNISAI